MGRRQISPLSRERVHSNFTNVVLEEIAKEDQEWENSRRSKPKHGQNIEAQEASTSSAVSKVPDKEPRPKSKAPPGFY